MKFNKKQDTSSADVPIMKEDDEAEDIIKTEDTIKTKDTSKAPPGPTLEELIAGKKSLALQRQSVSAHRPNQIPSHSGATWPSSPTRRLQLLLICTETTSRNGTTAICVRPPQPAISCDEKTHRNANLPLPRSRSDAGSPPARLQRLQRSQEARLAFLRRVSQSEHHGLQGLAFPGF